MKHYYNDVDPYVCEWIENLILSDLIPYGDVDDRRGLAARGRTGPVNGFWRNADWLAGRDAKWRPVEPGTSPLAIGVSGRVGRLRAYGNAINPHQASEFLKAAMECMP